VNNDRTLKKIFNTKPDGARSVGRPISRWEDGVDQAMRILEVKNWKKVALSRDKWAQLLNTLRTGDADLRLYAYKQFKYPVPNVLRSGPTRCCRANDDDDDDDEGQQFPKGLDNILNH
jgi:hypothetical protein